MYIQLKLSRNKKDLMTPQLLRFLVGFFAAGSWEKDTRSWEAVTSLRSLLFRDNFTQFRLDMIWVKE